MLRINEDNNRIELSRNGGRGWAIGISNNTSVGNLLNLQANGQFLYENTTMGLFYSCNNGRGRVRK